MIPPRPTNLGTWGGTGTIGTVHGGKTYYYTGGEPVAGVAGCGAVLLHCAVFLLVDNHRPQIGLNVGHCPRNLFIYCCQLKTIIQ